MLESQAKRGPLTLRRGFSLLEVVVVMTIMTLLATLLFPVVGRAVARARQTECRSNLRQFASALMIYRSEHRGKNPDWLSSLYPDYVDSRELYVCPSDKSRGEDGGKPLDLVDENRYEQTYDNVGNDTRAAHGANEEIKRCSYFYEFSGAEGTDKDIYKWWTGTWQSDDEFAPNYAKEPEHPYTWQVYKMKQRDAGKKGSDVKLGPYSDSRMPIVRCYHHWDEADITGRDADDGKLYQSEMTLNVGYAGNVFVAPLQWENRLDTTER